MHTIHLDKKVIKFIEDIPAKHGQQLKRKILQFQDDPYPQDSKDLIGYPPYKRCDCGEYRIVYKIEETKKIIYIILVGRRNDGDAYRKFKRLIEK